MTARISIDGNLVADPDFGVGDSGKSWAHLRVASHERMRRDGEWHSTGPEFYNVGAVETVANEPTVLSPVNTGVLSNANVTIPRPGGRTL